MDAGYTKKLGQTLKRGNFVYAGNATYTNYAGYTKKLGQTLKRGNFVYAGYTKKPAQCISVEIVCTLSTQKQRTDANHQFFDDHKHN